MRTRCCCRCRCETTTNDGEAVIVPPRQNVLFVDARDIITLTAKDGTPDYVVSESKLQAWFSALPPEQRDARILVVTGYIASTAGGSHDIGTRW